MAEKEGFEISPAGSVRVGSDSPPGCHSLPTRSNPFFTFLIIKKEPTQRLVLFLGGEGGIRTLDELLTHTRVPVVRHKPS